MKHFSHVVLVFLLILFFGCKPQKILTVGFYNVENLFDTEDDPKTSDEDFTPNGKLKWDNQRYAQKLTNLSLVISTLADGKAPDFLGLCEIENRKVLNDLVANKQLTKQKKYGIVQYESPDFRGIDVAFLYDKDLMLVLESKVLNVDISAYNNEHTREILYVKGALANKEVVHFFVNHWPSRRGGRAESEGKRLLASLTLLKEKEAILKNDPKAKIIIMGDFNDEPFDKSIQTLYVSEKSDNLKSEQMYNPYASIKTSGRGSYRFRDNWDMLDQIIISKSLVGDTTGYIYVPQSANIKNDEFMKQQEGKYIGHPFRTYGGETYLGGYSDHLPVYIKLKLIE